MPPLGVIASASGTIRIASSAVWPCSKQVVLRDSCSLEVKARFSQVYPQKGRYTSRRLPPWECLQRQ